MNYTVPSYLKNFHCKGGACGHSCCEGWTVSISEKEYFSLLGLEASQGLKSKLDFALKVKDFPTKESYAIIDKDYTGVCRLHGEDGLCLLQAELGEGVLPEICRIYPRKAEKAGRLLKCACANSCEETVEVLLGSRDENFFEEIDLPISPDVFTCFSEDEMILSRQFAEKFREKENITQYKTQIKTKTIEEKFYEIAKALFGGVYDMPQGFSKHDFSNGFINAVLLTKSLGLNSPSVSEYCKKTLEVLGLDKDGSFSGGEEKYLFARESFYTSFKNWETAFENLFANHIFYTDFPFSGDTKTAGFAEVSFGGLAAAYAIVKLNLVCCFFELGSSLSVSGFISSFFRLIEHTAFEINAVKTIEKNENTNREETLKTFLSLTCI